MTPSITRRLLISNLVILAAFLGLAGATLDRAFRTSAASALQAELQAHVYTLLTAAEPDATGRMRLPTTLAAPRFNQPDSGLYAEVTGEQSGYHWRSASLLGRELRLVRPSRPGETRLRHTPRLVVFDQGIAWEDDRGREIEYALSVAVDRAPADAALAAFRGTLWQWLGGVALGLLVAQAALVRWGLRPLRDMSTAVSRLEAGEATRIDGPVPAELRGLADNLNALIAQSGKRQERVRNSLADLAHSLKTPLAVLRGAVPRDGQTGAGVGELIDEQTRRIDEIVSYQRQRAAVAGTTGVTRPIGVRAVAARLCASLEKVHRERAVACRLEIAADLTLRADEGDLFELLGNLLENAFKHCRGEVRCSARRAGTAFVLTVEDDGPGLDPGALDRLLRRGARADQRHPGEGIGLAVVDEIVRQYGGHIDLARSPLGGAAIDVTLPA